MIFLFPLFPCVNFESVVLCALLKLGLGYVLSAGSKKNSDCDCLDPRVGNISSTWAFMSPLKNRLSAYQSFAYLYALELLFVLVQLINKVLIRRNL